MAHFYGTLHNGRSLTSRTGLKNGGLKTICKAREGQVECKAYFNETLNEDMIHVALHPTNRPAITLYDGPFNDYVPYHDVKHHEGAYLKAVWMRLNFLKTVNGN